MSKKKPKKIVNSFFKTPLYQNQKQVTNFLRENEISIIVGEAGTSKDFCCLYRALEALDTGEHSEVVLVKPIVEIGKSIGFLPGVEEEKTTPYQKSFEDNIIKMIGKTSYTKYKKKINFEPISFMRGNTFEYSTVIVSECQNLTLHELISVCTRVSSSSKLFLNGDPDQSDIGRKSGFKDFIKIVENIEGVGVMELGEEFQVRNPMIVKMNREYRKFLENKNG